MCLLTLQKRGGQGKENISLDENVNIWDISCDQSLASFDWAGRLLLQYKLLKYRHTMWRNICNWAQQWQSSGHMTDLCMHEVLACSISLQYLPAVFACSICIQSIPYCIGLKSIYHWSFYKQIMSRNIFALNRNKILVTQKQRNDL